MMDIEEQWKEEFLKNYLTHINERGEVVYPKAPINILEAIKKKNK